MTVKKKVKGLTGLTRKMLLKCWDFYRIEGKTIKQMLRGKYKLSALFQLFPLYENGFIWVFLVEIEGITFLKEYLKLVCGNSLLQEFIRSTCVWI